RHANIVQIHELGEHDGLVFFSMELAELGSLAKRLGGTPMGPFEASELVERLADAMQTAHEQGVIHRDLKPANIVFAGGDGSSSSRGESVRKGTPTAFGVPKITDFGLAKLADRDQTVNEAVIGTPSYMPPEQTLDARLVDPRTDVYALGAILYECLTGRPP